MPIAFSVMGRGVRFCYDCEHPLGTYGHPERGRQCIRWRRLVPDWM